MFKLLCFLGIFIIGFQASGQKSNTVVTKETNAASSSGSVVILPPVNAIVVDGNIPTSVKSVVTSSAENPPNGQVVIVNPVQVTEANTVTSTSVKSETTVNNSTSSNLKNATNVVVMPEISLKKCDEPGTIKVVKTVSEDKEE